MRNMTRRDVLRLAAASCAAASLWPSDTEAQAQPPGDRPDQAEGVTVLNPCTRAPVSLIIDDSTALVNLAHFGIPQFAEVFPDRYRQDWRKLPREIPDRFVQAFAEWCHSHGVKGKYSMVPYPACVGWIDQRLPGWTRRELEQSLNFVRTHMTPDWDIHPEMVSHTWVINTKTGRPYPKRTAEYMENWGWSVGRSADELADYIGYALRILRNVGFPCEGITTPGGFGNRSREALAQGTLEACRDVYQTEIPHYFRHLFTDDRSVAPRVEYASGLDSDDPRCVVSIIGCTGDWFGGWDGLTPGSADRCISQDLQNGRLPYVIGKGEPAILVCHWPGLYFNGEETGFNIFKEVVRRLQARYDNLIWMKLSELARYWAAKELTHIECHADSVKVTAPFACPKFTLELTMSSPVRPRFLAGREPVELREVAQLLDVQQNTFCRHQGRLIVCVDLPKGDSTITGAV